MNVFIYIIKSILLSGILFGYYWFFLRNRVFHRFNRIFLLSISVLSFLLPALLFPLPDFAYDTDTGSPIRLLGVGRGTLEDTFTIYANRTPANLLSWPAITGLLSAAVSIFLFCRFGLSIRYLLGLKKQNPYVDLQEAAVYFVSAKGTPFSFFRNIFWAKDMPLNSTAGEKIFRHELFHVKEYHTLDILYMEIFSIACWFNPFLYLTHGEIKALHEYTADAYAMEDSDEFEYARLLLLNISGTSRSIAHPFFKTQIKRRIDMITKIKKTSNSLLGRLMILPLIAGLVCLFSFKMENLKTISQLKHLRVVIDAGHGGIDPGVSRNEVSEKNINLAIAKKIQSLAKDYNIDVIMTRETDELPGKGNDIAHSLKYRAELPGRENADLFISIHTNSIGENSMQEKYTGFDIYIPATSTKVYESSIKLGTDIAAQIKPNYTMAPELKQRSGGILVLDNASVPSILIECGYIDNRYDIKYLMDNDSQEKIAQYILEGIRKYSQQK